MMRKLCSSMRPPLVFVLSLFTQIPRQIELHERNMVGACETKRIKKVTKANNTHNIDEKTRD